VIETNADLNIFWSYAKINLGMPTCMWFLTDNIGGRQDVIENYEDLKHNQPLWHPVSQTVELHETPYLAKS